MSKGFQTYIFWLDEVQRCFTVFHPLNRAAETLPVVLSPNCYAKDKLSGIDALNENSKANRAASRFGYIRIGLSTPEGNWEFGNDGVVNDDKPMPCSNEDSVDLHYVRRVMNFLESNPNQFNTARIYAQGFSQNSMFSAYIGFCLSEKIVGIWQGGSGMALTGLPPNLPGCEGQVKASSFDKCYNCEQCIKDDPCIECQYWPIYPCYAKDRPIIDCLTEYDNDYVSVVKDDPTKSTAIYMYDRLINEGHDARLLRFSPSDGNPGGHKNIQNEEYWIAGCLGISESCSKVRKTQYFLFFLYLLKVTKSF